MAYTYPLQWSYNNPIYIPLPGLLNGDVTVVGVGAQLSNQTLLPYVYINT